MENTHENGHKNGRAGGAMETTHMKTISNALHVLNDAAKESSDEIRHLINRDFRRVKTVFSDINPEAIGHMRDVVVDSTKEAVKKVDNSAHENPWAYAGATAALGAVAGFLLGRKFSN